MKFTKMHGAGQDYVFVDCFSERSPRNPHGLAVEVSDRQRGIGAEGLVLIGPSPSADARITSYNAYGEESRRCLNSLRCVAKYLFDRKYCDSSQVRIESDDHVDVVDVIASSQVAQLLKVDMGPPTLAPSALPTTLVGDGSQVSNAKIEIGDLAIRVTCLMVHDTHCIVFANELSDELVTQLGPLLAQADVFPQGVDVEFVAVQDARTMQQRSWQFASGEVPASVDGVSAACVAGVLTGRTERAVTIYLPGGALQVEWDDTSNHVFVTGSAVEVFSGEWKGLS